MKIILITGTSATGKSSAIADLEPLLRDIADLEINTGIHPISTTELILQHVGVSSPPGK